MLKQTTPVLQPYRSKVPTLHHSTQSKPKNSPKSPPSKLIPPPTQHKMSHHATHHHRRYLPPSDLKTPVDPTPTTTSSAAKPHPDPPTSATIQHISNHFSNLYSNHKHLSSFKPSSTAYPHPSVDTTHLQPKSMTTVSHSSAASLTKSHSQRRPNVAEMGKQGTRGQRLVKVKKLVKEFDEGQEIKREILNEGKKEREIEGMEIIKKPYALPTNQESDLKELQLQEYELKRQSFSSSSVGSGVRRRSFCSSQAELANFLSCNGVKIVSVDMPPFMQIHAVDCARKTHDSLEKFTAKTLALTLKKEFDGVYGPAWHCIVGTSFGSFVTHSVGGFLYFSMDQKHYVLLFKTTVQKAS